MMETTTFAERYPRAPVCHSPRRRPPEVETNKHTRSRQCGITAFHRELLYIVTDSIQRESRAVDVDTP